MQYRLDVVAFTPIEAICTDAVQTGCGGIHSNRGYIQTDCDGIHTLCRYSFR